MTATLLTVPPLAAGTRLDRWLAAQMRDISRARLQGLIEGGHVKVDASVRKAAHRLRGGEVVEVEVPPLAETLTPEPIALAIAYEDDHLLVVDKPAGMVVHPGAGQSHRTLAAAALAHAPQIAGIGSPRRPGIVHRLDKGTSGLLVLAKTPLAYDALTTQLAARTVSRRYHAVVDGSLGSNEGVVDAPLGRHPHDRIRMAVQAYGRGKRAVTRFRVLERGTAWTYLEAKLETGRTHQIRVHMASLGHPVYNDHLYGRGTRLRLPIDFEGLALHASDLGLVHPITQKRMEWVSPVPPRIQRLLCHLRNSC